MAHTTISCLALATALYLPAAALFAADPKPLWGYPGFEPAADAREPVQGKSSVPGQLLFPSPDKRYAISWPSGEETQKLGNEVANHLVDLQSGKSIHLIAKGDDADFEQKNHSELDALWRADSRAVLVRFDAKWGARSLLLLTIAEDGKVQADELTLPARKELLKVIKKQAAKFWKNGDDAQAFDASFGCEFSPDGKTLNLMALGETNPKMMTGQARIVANLTASFDPATHALTAKSGKITEAKIVKEE